MEGTNRPGDFNERRRNERRVNARIMDVTLPELRRMMLTTVLFIIVMILFLWMVRTVIIATILGIVVAVYLRPLYERIHPRLGWKPGAALLALMALIVPIIGLLVYSYVEIADVAGYVTSHQDEIAGKIDLALRKIPFLASASTGATIRRWVLVASNYGTSIPGMLRATIKNVSVAATIFMFTAFYVVIDAQQIQEYIRSKIPPRYSELIGALERNVRGVLYGAIYSTLLTQAVKSVIILLMNLFFGVPLAAVLAIISFIIGFFPIVGSWSVYVPVAIWLVIFRDAVGSAIAMIVIGTLVNTVFISTYLRPKIAADRSGVLNFYWMFVALITGVYTFGLAGILLGPILIGLLKAIIDTVTSGSTWKLIEAAESESTTD
ncbi:MAG: rane protein [Gemmatimonadetes bacterium]|nr:rane protein [Gemmatimonadota bacterium]